MKINPTVFRWLAIVWTIIMLIGCLTPHEELPGELVELNDKMLHAAIFAPFSILWILAGVRMNHTLIAGILLGALIEVLQYILPINRSADWIDFAADGLGVLIGIGLAWAVQKTRVVA